MMVGGELSIRNRRTKNVRSGGHVIRFKRLDGLAVTYAERTIQYRYDALARLTEADYDDGAQVLTYGHDLAGNLTDMNGVTRTYNAANQMTHDGTNALTYDANGNLTHDGANSYTWDRANRLLSMGGISYVYNGDGNRIQQDALKYILDLQPGLAQVVGDSDGNRYIHSPRGIHAVSDGANWQYPLTDALGSVRGYVDADNAVLSSVNYTEYGVPDTAITGFAFTGEPRDGNDLQYHRARYYNPALGLFPSLDSFEGIMDRPMSLNGYSWVEGNVPNAIDPSGRQPNCCHCSQISHGGRQDQCYIECLNSERVFAYNRTKARAAANRLAALGIADGLRFANYREYGASSARFISLVLYLGGFPMTKGPNGDDSIGANALGWRAKCTSEKLDATPVWLNHSSGSTDTNCSTSSRLIGYLCGSTDAGGNNITGLGINNYRGAVSTGDIFESITENNPYISLSGDNTLPSSAKLAEIMQRFDDISEGDYVYIDSSSDTHGFIITDRGPAVTCDTQRPLSDSAPEVFYVTDWGLQRNVARPFYCSRVPEASNGGWFNHTNWYFYKIPNTIRVSRERSFTPNFEYSDGAGVTCN